MPCWPDARWHTRAAWPEPAAHGLSRAPPASAARPSRRGSVLRWSRRRWRRPSPAVVVCCRCSSAPSPLLRRGTGLLRRTSVQAPAPPREIPRREAAGRPRPLPRKAEPHRTRSAVRRQVPRRSPPASRAAGPLRTRAPQPAPPAPASTPRSAHCHSVGRCSATPSSSASAVSTRIETSRSSPAYGSARSGFVSGRKKSSQWVSTTRRAPTARTVSVQ